MKTYNVDGLDADGCCMVRREAYTLKEARKEMTLILGDAEFINSGMVRVAVSDDETDECLLDKFVQPYVETMYQRDVAMLARALTKVGA